MFALPLGLDNATDLCPPIAVATICLEVCVWMTADPEEHTPLNGSVSVPTTGENLTAQVIQRLAYAIYHMYRA